MTAPRIEEKLLGVFQEAARRVPAYRAILEEKGVRPERIASLADFVAQVPEIDKRGTFGRFDIADLCLDGKVGRPLSLLTSSGHSGRFSFGVYDAPQAQEGSERADAALDAIFGVRTRPTLLINCLPMGVKVHTQACTVAETSVRADMATALVRHFARHFEQVILVGDAAFLKHVLEWGIGEGIDWPRVRLHMIVGEEPIAENARKYLEHLAGIAPSRPDGGLIGSSMGVAELELNVFFELPPLIAVRRALHEDARLRQAVFGNHATNVPMIFTYDPGRAFVEVLGQGRLVVTILDPHRRVPLVRYATGDVARFLARDDLGEALQASGLPADALAGWPLLAVFGRGDGARAGDVTVSPEQVKEGLYLRPELARLTTANFRLASGPRQAMLRVQLSPGVKAEPTLDAQFAQAVARYTPAALAVHCEEYEAFGSGMSLDYERKFAYLDPEPGDPAGIRATRTRPD